MVALNFNPEFVDKIKSREKRSTIRKTMRCKIGDTLHLFTGQRTKNCVQFGTARCIGIGEIVIGLDDGTPWAFEGRIGDVLVSKRFAHQEGFQNEQEMVNFFKEKYGIPFKGYVHTWELLS